MDIIISSWLLWLIIAAILIIIELLTSMIATFCLAAGCLVAMVCALLGWGIETQLTGAIIGTVIAFILVQPLIRHRKETIKKQDKSASNMDALIGRTAVLTESITEYAPGRTRIDGVNWQIRTNSNAPLTKGSKVRIIGYDSIILIAEPI